MPISWFRLIPALGLVLLMLGSVAPALAQSVPGTVPAEGAGTETRRAAETERLIEILRDPEERALLLRQLELLRAAQELDAAQAGEDAAAPDDPAQDGPAQDSTGSALPDPDQSLADALAAWTGQGADSPGMDGIDGSGGGALRTMGEVVVEIRSRLENSWAWLTSLSGQFGRIDQMAGSAKFRAFWTSISWEPLLILAVAGIVAGIAHFLLRRPAQRLLGHARTVSRLIWRNALGIVLKLLPAILFGLTGYILVIALRLGPVPGIVAMALINAQTSVLLIMFAGSLEFTTARGRVMPEWFTVDAANFLRSAILYLAITLSYGVMMIELTDAMGIDAALIRLLMHLVGFATLTIALYTICRLRRILALHEQVRAAQEIDALAADAESAAAAIATRSMAKAGNSLRRNWSSFATIGVLALYLLWMIAPVDIVMFSLRGAILTILVTIFLRALTKLIRRAFRRQVAEEGAHPRWSGATWQRLLLYADVVRLGIAAILVVLGGILILQIWGVDFVAWLSSPLGQRVAGSLVTIVLLIIGGMVLSELFSITVENHLQKRNADYSDLSRRSRARTLLPLLRNVVRVTLATIITLLVLGEIGIEIGPLLAAAGVVGLAVGFGAQTLVKDIITGIFILLEDTIAVGDVVDLGGNSGVVESMTIRTVRLRDEAGTVHTVPFSAITKVMNMTRDFSFAVFEVAITYDQDITRAMDVIQQTGADLRRDPTVARDILEPMSILGVDRFGELGLIIKARIKTKPIRQWDVARNFNRRIKEAFDEARIDYPFPSKALPVLPARKLPDEPDGATAPDPA